MASYGEDDYESPIDPTMAIEVTDDFLKYVAFNEQGLQVAISSLANHPTKVFLHGWRSSLVKARWYEPLRLAYQAGSTPVNIVYVDYEHLAELSYSVAAASIKSLAALAAARLLRSKIDVHNMHIIGFSMGSHIAGFIGRHVKKFTGRKVGRLTLLDPAGPKFEKTLHIVGKDDAEFVDAIHTDAGHFGLVANCGHVDVFPNGGVNQPGCSDTDENCSHARAVWIFVESVSCKEKIARKANSWEEYLKNVFLDEEPTAVGEHMPTTARGTYYFTPNPTPPYLASGVPDTDPE